MKTLRLRSGDASLLEWLFLLILIIPLINAGIPVALPTNYALANPGQDQPDLEISKSDSPDPVFVGGNLTYTVTVSNKSNFNATGVNVTDTLPQGVTFLEATASTGSASHSAGVVTWNIGFLREFQYATLTILVTAPSTSGNITNTANVSGSEPDPDPTNNTASENTTVSEVPPPTDADLAISKTDSPDPVLASGNLTYTVTVTNNGTANATGVNIVDDLPPEVTFVSATGGGTYNGTAHQVTWNIGNLNNGASATRTIVVTAPSSSGNITNVVSVLGSETDPNLTNNSDSENTTVNEIPPPTDADLAVSKSDSPDPVFVSENLTYTVTVTNNGLADATGVNVTDTLPLGVTFLKATPSTGTANETAGNVTWDVGNLNNGASATLTIVVTAPSTADNISNVVSVSGSETDPNLTNNSDSENTTVNEIPPPTDADLAVSKSDSPDPVFVSENLTYTVNVTNNGTANATGVNIVDDLPPEVTFVSATGGGTYNGTAHQVTWNIGNLNNGASETLTIVVTAPSSADNITNVVSVSGSETDPNLTNNSDSENTTVNEIPPPTDADLAVSKSDSPDPVFVSENLTYTVTVTNYGPDDATGVNVTDFWTPGLIFQSANASTGSVSNTTDTVTWYIGNLTSGATANLSILVIAPSSSGNISNNATVSGIENDPVPGNDSDTANTTVNPGPAFSLDLTPDSGPKTSGTPFNVTITAYDSYGNVASSYNGTANFTSTDPSATLPPDYTFNATDAGTYTFTNGVTLVTTGNQTVTVTDTINSSLTDTSNFTVTTPPTADLVISKLDSPDPVPLGGNLTYTITVTNNGTADATGVNVLDILSENVTFISANTATGNYTELAGNVTWNIGNLASGASANLTILTTVNRTMLRMFPSANITNTANVSGNENDPDQDNNTVTVNTTVTTTDLAIIKTDSVDPVFLGDNFTYTVNITNNGTDNATGVFVVDRYAKEWLIFHSANASVGTVNETIPQWVSDELVWPVSPYAFGTLYWDVGDLPSGASANLTIIASVNVTTVNAKLGIPFEMYNMLLSFMGSPFSPQFPIYNEAYVLGDVAEPDYDNNGWFETTNVTLDLPVTDLAITKTDSPDPVLAGDNLTYTVTVTNNGTVNATFVNVLDILSPGVTFISANTATGSANQTIPQWFIDLSNLFGGASVISYLQMFPIVWWDIGDLASGDSANLTVLATVNATIQGTIYNEAAVFGKVTDPDYENNAWSENTTVTTLEADLSITKMDSPDPVLAGDNLTYYITVTNNGPDDATGVNVTDILLPYVSFNSANVSTGSYNVSYVPYVMNTTLALVTWNVSDLAANASANMTIFTTVNSSIITTGTFSNTASISGDVYDPVSGNNTFTVDTFVTDRVADLGIKKTDSPDPVFPGDNLTYYITVTNNGPDDAIGVNVTDTLWPYVSFNSANTSTGSTSLSYFEVMGFTITTVHWNIDDLAANASANMTIFTTVNSTLTPGNFIIQNTAEVFSNLVVDNVSANDTATANTTVTPQADLSIAKSDSPDPVTAGDNLTYLLTVTNNSFDPATGVTVTDTLPPEVTFQSANATIGTASNSTGNVTWNIGTLGYGGSANLSILVTAPLTAANITNTANVSGNEHDPNTANNTVTINTTVTTLPPPTDADLWITKTATPEPVFTGGNLTYLLIVTNNGTANATGVKVTDNLSAANVTYQSATESTGNVSESAGVVTWNIGNLNNGATANLTIRVTVPSISANISNTANVSGNEPDPVPGNDSDTANTTVITAPPAPTADLVIAKTATPEPVALGGNLTYLLTVTNNGTADATGVNVTDILSENVTFIEANTATGNVSESAGNVTWNIGNLASGASANLTILTTVNRTILMMMSSANLTNTANVSGNEPDPDPDNNTVTENTTLTTADLAINKTDSTDPVFLGDNFTYTVNITNNGTDNATGVFVLDAYSKDWLIFHSANASVGSVNETIPQWVSDELGITVNTTTVGTLYWDVGDLPSGASANLTIVASVNTTAVNAILGIPFDMFGILSSFFSYTSLQLPIYNYAYVLGNVADPDPDNNIAWETTNATLDLPITDLAIIKSDSPDPVTAGDNLTYTINITNNSTDNATFVNVLDILSENVTFLSASTSTGSANQTIPQWFIDLMTQYGYNITQLQALPIVWWDVGDLASGASANLTVLTAVNATTQGTIYNQAGVFGNVTDPNMFNNWWSESTTVAAPPPTADLVIAKTDSPDPVLVGENLTYLLTVTNNGTANATGVNVTDTLSAANVTFLSANTTTGNYSESAGVVTWEIGNLTVDATANLTILVMAPSTPGLIANTANVSGNETDPNLANNTVTVNTTVTPQADLAITKTASPDPVPLGGNLTYLVTVSNNGTANATGVNVTDILSENVTFISANTATGNYSESAGVVTWNIGNINNGASANLTILTTVNRTIEMMFFTSANLTNTANVVANEHDPDPANNTVTENTTLTTTDLAITKTDSTDPVSFGDNFTYTVNITNNGTDNATGVFVLDGYTKEWLILHSVNASVGSVNETIPQWVSDELGVTVNTTTSGTIYWDVGDLASGASANLTIIASVNTTAVNATFGIPFDMYSMLWSFSDIPYPRHLPIYNAAIGTLWSFLDIPFYPWLPIYNEAYVLGNVADPDFGNNIAWETTNVNFDLPVTDLAIIKSDSPDPVLAGDNLTYSINVTNWGEVTANATGVFVLDILSENVTFISANASTGSANQTMPQWFIDLFAPFGVNVTQLQALPIVWWDIGDLARGASANLTVLTTVNATTQGTIYNEAAVLGTVIDDYLGNNWVSENTTVNPRPVASLDLTPDSGTKTSGTPFSVNVTALDSYGNVVTSYNGTVTFNSTDSSATLPPDYTFNSTDAGSHTFTNGVTLRATGNQIVTVTDNLVSSLTDNTTFTVTRVIPPTPTPDGNGDDEEEEKPTEPEEEEGKYYTVDFLGKITTVPIASDGSLLQPLQAPSPDGKHLLEIEKGTRVLDAEGKIVTLNTITALKIADPELPGLPHNKAIVGYAYNFEPSGIIFSKPVRLTMSYDVNELPERAESVALAYYNPESGWIDLKAESIVLAEIGTITASIYHFTIFAILAEVTPPPAPAIVPTGPPAPTILPAVPPANFMLSNLSITPSLLEAWEHLTFIKRIGEEATISVEVTNTGGQHGSYTVNLITNGMLRATKEISLEPGQTQKIAFSVSENEPGDYIVQIGRLSGEFQSSVWINWWLITGFAAVFILLCWLAWRYIWKIKKRKLERAR